MWPFRKKKAVQVPNLLPIYIQLDRIENNIHYLYKRVSNMTVAYDELAAAVNVAVGNIAALADKIATAPAAGTSDEQLSVLTAQLKAATDAVAGVLTPPAV